VIAQGDVWWASLPEPVGSTAGYDRPVVVVQGDAFNRSRTRTILSVPLTGNLKWSRLPGNVLLRTLATGLDNDSVANCALVLAVDRSQFVERVGRIDRAQVDRLLAGIDLVLGR